MRGVNGHLGTVFKKFLALIFHSEKLGSAPVQHQFSTVQPAEPLLNLAHELVHRRTFFDFLTFSGSFGCFLLFCFVCVFFVFFKNSNCLI